MSETPTVNDLVVQHAEKNKTSQPESEIPNKSQDNPDQSNDTPEPKKESVDDIKAELEKLRKENEELKKPVKKVEPTKKTPEEEEKEIALYKANLIQFATANGELKPDDFSKLDMLNSKADHDLVFEHFQSEFKEENPEADADEIRSAFEDEYKINSANEKTKERGAKRLAKEAKDIRSPLVSSYEKVKNRFDNETALRQSYPEYAAKIQQLSLESIPGKMEIFKDKDGDEDVQIDMDLSESDKKEITEVVSKKMQTPETYSLYKEGKLEDIQKMINAEAESFIWSKYRPTALKKVAETFVGRGMKKGSNVGATTSFAVSQTTPDASAKKSRTDKEQEIIDSLNGKK